MLKIENPTRPETIDDLLTGQLVARLNALDVTSRKVLAGKLKGERRSKKRGESVEFADHRPYVIGDDLRHIDWNIFGRLDRMFLKLFLEEEDLALHIVIDASASSDCGNPSKFLLMQRLALALGYIGLSNMHRLTCTAVAGVEGGVLSSVRDLRGRRRLMELAKWLCGLEPIGGVPFGEACKRIALTRRGKGVTIVLSDFFHKEGYETGLRLLVGRGYDVYAVQVLSPQELQPDLGGDLRLKDCEDGDLADITVSAPLLKRYQATLTAYCNRLRDFCAAREIMHLTVPSSIGVDVLVLDYLRRRGLVK